MSITNELLNTVLQPANAPAATLTASPRPAIDKNSLRDTSWPAWRNTVFSSSLVKDM